MRLVLILASTLTACSGTTGDVLFNRNVGATSDLAGLDQMVVHDLGTNGDFAGLTLAAFIVQPSDGATTLAHAIINFAGHAGDPSDKVLIPATLVWESNLDGTLGTGEMITAQVDTPGTHTITLTATDSSKVSAKAQISLIAK